MARYGRCKKCGKEGLTRITKDLENKSMGHLCLACWFEQVGLRANLGAQAKGFQRDLP